MENKVKIFISYKEKHELLKSDILQPIQTGRAIAKENFDGMIGDDAGDNISVDNPRYNELSAQYWVWKHYDEIGNPEYAGFMHYRRHFVFDKTLDYADNEPWFPGMSIFKFDNFDSEHRENISDKNILKTLNENYDCYVLKSYDVRFFHNNDLYMKEHYISTIPGARRYIWNVFYNAVKNYSPEYSKLIDEFAFGHVLNPCNMFIMKKELFFEYSQFCFDILKIVDENVDSSRFSSQEKRFLGYLCEYLLTIFVIKLSHENHKIKYLDGLLFMNMKPSGKIKQSLKKSCKKFLSVNYTNTHKIYKFFGITFKTRIRNAILKRLNQQEYLIKVLTDKVTDLQEAVILNTKNQV